MLDESREHPIAGDPNDYVVGTIPATDGAGTHLVVLTLLKEMGNNSAAAAAANLLRSFPQVEDVLMVGIAGGIPAPDDPNQHVRLGDVVVSDKEGVVQYDNLKVGVDTIRLRSSAAKPSARMIGRVNLLEAGRLSQQYPWESNIQRGASLEGSQRPPEETDKVYRWSGSEAEEINHPCDSSRRPGKPKIHCGRIGAANMLLKNPELRDQLRNDCGVKAIEMEGSGVADGTWTAGQHYLVIRGICDYCDPKKEDTWQGHAAVVAAAYARALIASVPVVAHDAGQRK
jgi:nucleoside phosphorylase